MIKNQKGIAILLVLTSITILTTLLINFSFDAKINRIKSINVQDRTQAKLNAESGLELSMARLKLYKEAYNYIEGNSSAKSFVPAQVLNQVWQFPFMYPIPILPGMGAIQKSLIQDFDKDMVIAGGMQIDIRNQSLKFNINMLRFSFVQKYNEENAKPDPNADKDDEEEIKFEDQVLNSLKNAIDRLSLSDEEAYNYYRTIELEKLIAFLKYYISDLDSYEDELYLSEAKRTFEDKGITPKHAPMASFEEMYLLPEWDDFLIDVIRNEFTVHPNLTIDLNSIDSKMLRLLVPNITDEEIEAFFLYRDSQEDPKYFNELSTFKAYIVDSSRIMINTDFDDRFASFQRMGIRFGPAPTLFLVKSVGLFGRAQYQISAFVAMPSKPKKDLIDTSKITDADQKKKAEADNKRIEEENKKNYLLEPRVTEIYNE